MNKLTIEGVPGIDGEYEFEDFDTFTNRELHRIKKLTGLRAGEFEEAFAAGDNDMLVALAVVVLERNEKQVVDDLLWNAPAGAFSFDLTDDAEDPTKDEAPSPEHGSNERPSASEPTSGDASTVHSDRQENGQSSTGIPHSDMSVTSDRVTLAS